MTNQYSGEHIELLAKLATRPGGVSSSEFAKASDKDIAWASRYIGNRVSRGLLICAKLSHKVCRYFTKQQDADRWLASLAMTVVVPVKVNTGTPPALLPGEPIIPKGVKIQRGPDFTPRYQAVPLLTDKPQPVRSGGEDFKQYKSRGF